MSRIKIKNFGPIHDGFIEDDGWMDVKKVTVLIGDQGSGKSTMAKLVSIFSWFEKYIVRNGFPQLTTSIFKNLCTQQDISEYFNDNTYIAFDGDVCNFEYDERNNSFKGSLNTNRLGNYVIPKIQYISSARNLLTILYTLSIQSIAGKEGNLIDLASNIPFMVRDLNNEYLKALSELAKDGFQLPLNETSVYFQNHRTFIKTKDKEVPMYAASSGVQSITPLMLVSHYLSNEVQKDLFFKVQFIDNNLKNRIESKLRNENEILADNFNKYCSLGKEVLSNDEILALESRLKNFINSSFINIVEEPEQNLFPSSQQKVLYSLSEHNNAIDNNKLIVTTHSPYIINYLMLAIKALEIEQKAGNNQDIKSKIYEIVPEKALIPLQSVAIYELDEQTGNISRLENSMGLPSNDNYLNNELGETNMLFSNLMEIEDLCGE